MANTRPLTAEEARVQNIVEMNEAVALLDERERELEGQLTELRRKRARLVAERIEIKRGLLAQLQADPEATSAPVDPAPAPTQPAQPAAPVTLVENG